MRRSLIHQSFMAISCLFVLGTELVQATEEKITVFVSIPPQAYLVNRLGGKFVQVETLMRPVDSHENFQPTPRQLLLLEKAKLFVQIGLPFEETLIKKIKSNNPNLKICDQRKDISLLYFSPHSAPDDGHHPNSADPHIWLDPKRLQTQSRTIAQALIEINPGITADVLANQTLLISELVSLDQRIEKKLAPFKGQSIFVYHPAFGYFADSYGLRQEAVEVQGKEPSARYLSKLIAQAQSKGVRTLFVQPQFSQKGAQLVAEAIGAELKPWDPLAPELMKNLEEMAEQISQNLRSQEH